jgi:short-subunit dehydrogenase
MPKHTLRQNILITGASSGLGEGMARAFAAKGRHLALCARRTERLDALKIELERQYPQCKIWVKALDVNDADAVFRVFSEFNAELGGIDRVIVNAGVGHGRKIGTGHFETNRHTAETNFVAALAQCEAAMEIFRQQNSGHLVTISSMSAIRGLPKHLTTYAASKAALASLTEGILSEMQDSHSPINVTAIYPGYIHTDINKGAKNLPFVVSLEDGVAAMVKSIEKENARAYVPEWPWRAIGMAMTVLPLPLVKKLVGP